MNICDCCYKRNNENASKLSKIEVSNCFACGGSMCQLCTELGKSWVGKDDAYGFILCQDCVKMHQSQDVKKIFLESLDKAKVSTITKVSLFGLYNNVLAHDNRTNSCCVPSQKQKRR